MLEQKKISSKINYDVLKDLNVKPGASPAQSPKKDPAASKIGPRQRRPAQAPLTLSTPLSTLGKRWVCPASISIIHRGGRTGTHANRAAIVSCPGGLLPPLPFRILLEGEFPPSSSLPSSIDPHPWLMHCGSIRPFVRQTKLFGSL